MSQALSRLIVQIGSMITGRDMAVADLAAGLECRADEWSPDLSLKQRNKSMERADYLHFALPALGLEPTAVAA